MAARARSGAGFGGAGDRLEPSRVSRAEALARSLEEEIATAALPPGERLGTKEELRRRFGVAVATLNEAVRLLETRGLIVARPGPGGGVFVSRPSVQARLGQMVHGLDAGGATLRECVEFRNALEPVIWSHASARRTKRDLKRLESIVAEMGETTDAHGYFRLNWTLHRTAAQLCTNGPVRNLYLTLIDAIEEGLDDVEFGPPARVDVEVHQRLVEATAERDERRLAAALRDHAKRSPLPGGGPAGTTRG
jgi:DNA-binding FadR family transcriptional regulator